MPSDELVKAALNLLASFAVGLAASLVAARIGGLTPGQKRLVIAVAATGAGAFLLGVILSPSIGRVACFIDCAPRPSDSPGPSAIAGGSSSPGPSTSAGGSPGGGGSPATGVTPGPTVSTADGCPDGPFLGWTQEIPRSSNGLYTVHLGPCDLLWFNSGSVSLDGKTLGGDVAAQNSVLLYRSTVDRVVHAGVGTKSDLGNEWVATTSAGSDSTVQAWAPHALGDGNCGGSCDTLLVFDYLDGSLTAKNLVVNGSATGPCKAGVNEVLTSLDNRLWQWNGGYLHVEFYRDGQPERESILPFDQTTLGYRVLAPLAGFVWSYPASCSFDEVHDKVLVHIDDRIRSGARNDGYVGWQETGLFEPIGAP